MKFSPHLRKRARRQGGYMLLAIIVMLTLALIALTAMAPYVVTQIKRDREDELIRRGKAYANAVKRFYKRTGRYPASLAELQSTGNVRFLRKLYKDPLTPDGEWRIIHFGEAKYFPKGFGMNNIPGASPAGGGAVGAQVPGGLNSIFGGSSSPAPGAPVAGGQANQPNTGGMTPADQISKPIGGSSQQFGGAPIIGVASKNENVGIHEINERKKINEWEFFYDPRYDVAAMVAPGAVGGAMPGSPNQQVSPFGQQPNSFGNTFGQGSGSGPGTHR